MPTRPKRRELDTAQRNQLIGAIKSHGNVSRAARQLGISQGTAKHIWKRYQDTGTTDNRPRTGRPPLYTPPEKELIVGYAVAERRKPFRDIGNKINPRASESTVRRILAEQDYHRRIARKVPLLKPVTKAKRLTWALERRQDMRTTDWDRIAWSDEAYVCLDDKKGQIWVTRRPGEVLLDDCCVPQVPQSPVRLMVWGIIMRGAKGPLVVLEYPGGRGGGMTADRYIQQVLKGPLLDFYTLQKRRRRGFRFQQDGAASHRAKKTRAWLDDHKIPVFPHPPTSPNLSPIEPLWHVLKTRLRDFQPRPSNEAQLRAAILEIWAGIVPADFDRFIERMPEVVDAVITAEGGHTRY